MFKQILKKIFYSKELEKQEADKAKQKSKEIILNANEEALSVKQKVEEQARVSMNKTLEVEKRLSTKEQYAEDQRRLLEKEKSNVTREKDHINKVKKELEEMNIIIIEEMKYQKG